MLGKIENHQRIAKLTDIRALAYFAAGLVKYLHRKVPDDTPRYPTHRTADDQRIKRNKVARAARAARKTA